MSWDVIVLDLPRDAETPADIPDDWEPRPIMSRDALLAVIRGVEPTMTWIDPGETTLGAPGLNLEISVGTDDPVQTFTFHSNGGAASAGVVAEVLRRLDVRALDTGTGEFFDVADATAGLDAWRDWSTGAIRAVSDASRPD